MPKKLQDYLSDPSSLFYAQMFNLHLVDKMPVSKKTDRFYLAEIYSNFLTLSAFLHFFPHSKILDGTKKEDIESRLIQEAKVLSLSQAEFDTGTAIEIPEGETREAVLLQQKKRNFVKNRLDQYDVKKEKMVYHPFDLFCRDNDELTVMPKFIWQKTTEYEKDVKSMGSWKTEDVMGDIYPLVAALFPVIPQKDSSEIALSLLDIEQIKKDPALYETLLFNFAVMMNHYGFQLTMTKPVTGGYTIKLAEPLEEQNWMYDLKDDDIFSINRILLSLSGLGFQGIAKLLLAVLDQIRRKPDIKINQEAYDQWQEAYDQWVASVEISIEHLPKVERAPLNAAVLYQQYLDLLQKTQEVLPKEPQKKYIFSSKPNAIAIAIGHLQAVMENDLNLAVDINTQPVPLLQRNLATAAEIARGYLVRGGGKIQNLFDQLLEDILLRQADVFCKREQDPQPLI